MTKIPASKVYYIKLGMGSDWEAECLKEGTLRFGYHETSSEALRGDWQVVRDFWYKFRKDKGAATRDVNQIRIFFEADENTLFITFANSLLHWCRPCGPVKPLADGHLRATVDGWHSTSLGGTPLTTDRLSGHLLKVQMFQGTICEVKALDYLLRKLGDELLPEVAAADETRRRDGAFDLTPPFLDGALLGFRDFAMEKVDIVLGLRWLATPKLALARPKAPHVAGRALSASAGER